MKTANLRHAIATVAALTLAAAAGLALAVDRTSSDDALQLEGTWLVQVTRHDCSSGADLDTFPAMNSFVSTGSLVEFATTPNITPAMRTPGLGNWQRTGPRRFHAIFSLFFLPDGVTVGALYQISRTIIMTGPNHFRADASVQILDPTGTMVVATGCAKETARRGYETALKQNDYWLARLQSIKMFGRDPGEILTRPKRIDALTPQILQEVFKRYFPAERSTVVTLVPAASAQP